MASSAIKRVFDEYPLAVPVSMQAPEGWGAAQRLIAELRRLGYRVAAQTATAARPLQVGLPRAVAAS